MSRSCVTGPLICTACPVPHPTRDFYFHIPKWPLSIVECREAHEARVRRETREQVYATPDKRSQDKR
jgi:hypothetical protein